MRSHITTVLIDNHEMVRIGLQLLLEREGVEVVAQGNKGSEALSLITTHNPDVAIIEINLPELNGIDVAAQLSRTRCATRIVMTSASCHHEELFRALNAGALGFVWKGGNPLELILATRAAFVRRTFISPGAGAIAGETLYLAKHQRFELDRLTVRQRQVVQLIAEGLTNKEIAASIDLTVKAVEKHRAQIMSRLGVHNTAQLVRFALRTRLVVDS